MSGEQNIPNPKVKSWEEIVKEAEFAIKVSEQNVLVNNAILLEAKKHIKE